MTFQDILAIVRRDDPEVPAGEVALRINSYMKDICHNVEPVFAVASFTLVADKTDFELADFVGSVPTIATDFMKLRSVWADSKVLPQRDESIPYDRCYDETLGGFQAGILQETNFFSTFPVGTLVEMVYYSYPQPVTVASTTLPLPWSHPMLLWRVKADMYAEKRQWDRAGYYNKRYERSLVEFRRMFLSSGPKKIVHPNMEI